MAPKTLKHSSYLLPTNRKSGFCLVSSEQTITEKEKNDHQAKKTAEKSLDQGGIPLKQKSQEHKAIENKKSGLLQALKQPHKGNGLNCSRAQHPPQLGVGEVGWGQNSEKSNCGVNTKNGSKGMIRASKETSACVMLKGQNLSTTRVSVSSKVLCNTSNSR